MAIAQLSKVRIEYFPHGEGPEHILFIHGFLASARIWRLVQEALPVERYTTVAINNRGAGGSDAPPTEDDFSVPHFAADACELVTQLGWKDFTLVGHSLGGATAAQFAVDQPTLLKGLVLLDPADPDGRKLPPGVPSMEEMLDRMIAGRRPQQERGRVGEGIDTPGSGARGELLRQLAEGMRNVSQLRMRGSMRSMFDIRLGARVKSLPMPVIVAGGDADTLVPVANILATWAKYPAGTGLHFWHGIGHSPQLDCPDEVAALLRRFIEKTIPTREKKMNSSA